MKIGNSKNRSLRLEFNWKKDKFGTIIDIFRVLAVVAVMVLFILSASGCKEKTDSISLDWEPVYPTDISFGGDSKSVTFEINEDNEILCDDTREEWLKVFYEIMSGKEPNRPVTLRFKEPEPNEPEWN